MVGADNDLIIFGDWGYGPEDNRYGIAANSIDETLIYGDPRLE